MTDQLDEPFYPSEADRETARAVFAAAFVHHLAATHDRDKAYSEARGAVQAFWLALREWRGF